MPLINCLRWSGSASADLQHKTLDGILMHLSLMLLFFIINQCETLIWLLPALTGHKWSEFFFLLLFAPSCQWIRIAILSWDAQKRKLARKKSGFNQQSYPVTIITVHLLTESWSTYGAIFTPSLNNSIGGKFFFRFWISYCNCQFVKR